MKFTDKGKTIEETLRAAAAAAAGQTPKEILLKVLHLSPPTLSAGGEKLNRGLDWELP